MIQILFKSGRFKGSTVATVLSRQSGQEYIDRQPRGIKEHLGILETRNREKKEAGK